ncbi:MAG: alpha/beta fold hydrolase [Rhodospirillaceae bacterium]|nr:alpha/beta fold hydrolase [Rhodospirillaceae bacterium]
MSKRVAIAVDSLGTVTAIAYPAAPAKRARVSVVLAHGAGGNQESPFMVEFAQALAARGLGTLTFNFLYSEKGTGAPDRSDKLEACYRGIVDAFHAGAFGKDFGGRLVIGGKSMGGRIASHIAAGRDDLAGLVFLGYPLHPPGQPAKLRSKHLPGIKTPMLFVQGSRDAFGTPEELRPILRGLKAPVELCVVEGGDHSFKASKSTGRTPAQIRDFMLDAIERWVGGLK